MLARTRRFLAAPVFEGDVEKTRTARLLNAILLFILFSGALLPLAALIVAPTSLLINSIVAVVLASGTLGLMFAMRRGQVRLASFLVSALFLLVVTAGVMMYGGIRSATAKSYLLVILMAGLLIGWRGAMIFGALSVLSAFAAFYAERNGLIGLPYAVSGAGDLIVLIGIFGLTAVLLSFALRSISAGFESARRNADQLADRNRELRAIRASLERRTARLQMATDVSHGIARVLDPERLFDRIVELIADLFDLHYVGLFMIDPDSDPTDREVVLRAGAGDGRRNFVLAEYRAAMGDDSIVGRCLATVEPQVAYVGPNKEGYHQDEILDGVRTLIALPLQSRGRLLGVLMIQSQEVDAFDDKDLVIMATMADQAAAAIDGTRLRTEAQESASRLESIVRQYVQESWTRLVEEQDTISGYCYDDGRAQPDQDAWLPIMEMAARQQDLVVTQDDGEASVAVPLVQNGVMIGVVGLKRGKGEEWSANEQSMLRAVSEQMTQALENRRLFQVARDRARREYVLRQTTDRVRTQASLDAVLRIAAEEMRRIAGATHVAIRLQTPESGKESVDEPRYS